MTLRSLLFGSAMSIEDVTFDWNGQTIRFSDWSDDAYGIFQYMTRDYAYNFTFDLQPIESEVRIYIVEQPSYGSRASDGHSTHRMGLPDKPCVCVDHRLRPVTVPEALSWAIYWAEKTAEYIRTGKKFS